MRNPPFEFTIFDKSYSKYVPSRVSRCSGLEDDATGPVGEYWPAGVTVSGLLLFGFTEDDEEAACSF